MASFKYKAIDKSKQTIKGVVEAEDKHSAVKELQKMGYFILDIQVTKAQSEKPKTNLSPMALFVRWFINPILAGATIGDLAVFYHQLSTMVKSGMSLVEAMSSLRTQGGNRRLRKIAVETMEFIQSGGRLSDAFARYPWMFPEIQVSLIRAGESGGTLDKMLERIAEYLDKEQQLRQKLQMSTLYPKLLVLAVIFIPSLPSLILGSPASYLRATFGILVPMLMNILILWAVYRLLYQIPAFKYAIDCIKLSLPKIGKTVRMLALSKFYRVLSAMYAAGAPVSQGMTQAADACGNWFLASRLKAVVPMLEQGRSFRESIGSAGVLPQMALDMLATGEQTGSVDTMLDKAAEYTENEAEVATVQMTVILGVVLLAGVAIYIGMMVVSFWGGYARGLENM